MEALLFRKDLRSVEEEEEGMVAEEDVAAAEVVTLAVLVGTAQQEVRERAQAVAKAVQLEKVQALDLFVGSLRMKSLVCEVVAALDTAWEVSALDLLESSSAPPI